MIYVARNVEIHAAEVATIIDGKPSDHRYFAVPGVGLIDAAAFLSLYAPKAASILPPPTVRNEKGRRPVKRSRRPKFPAPDALSVKKTEPLKPCAPISVRRPGEPTLRDRILGLLEKGGLTSRDLFETLYKSGVATTQGSVYQTCADLKQDGLVESRRDEADAKQKYFRKADLTA